MTFIEYQALTPSQKASYKIKEFFSLLPGRLKAFFFAIGKFFKNLGLKNMSKTQPSTPTVKERSVF